jgi:mono/diheme cytochrome c family protein
VTGCTDCHAEDLRGKLFIDEGWLHGRIYSANLVLKAKHYSDEDFSRLVRLGVRPDGRGVNVMPSMGFVRLTDEEMADIVAFVRSLPAGGAEQPDHFIGPLTNGRCGADSSSPPSRISRVNVQSSFRMRAPSTPLRDISSASSAWNAIAAISRAMAGILARPTSPSPGLFARRFQEVAAHRHGRGRPQLGLMSTVARNRLHHLSDEQIAGIHAYLLAYAGMAR